jgi:hypothetical protein
MAHRKSISARERIRIFRRDDYTCQYCGATGPMVPLHLDHVIPVSSGGGNNDRNLVTACQTCNLGKGAGRFLPAASHRMVGEIVLETESVFDIVTAVPEQFPFPDDTEPRADPDEVAWLEANCGPTPEEGVR